MIVVGICPKCKERTDANIGASGGPTPQGGSEIDEILWCIREAKNQLSWLDATLDDMVMAARQMHEAAKEKE